VAFILAADGRDADIAGVVGMFGRYRDYLQNAASRFPPSAFGLATSDWYFNFSNHRCPHDAWLEVAELCEHSFGSRHQIRGVHLKVRLLGAYHDGFIELRYPRVISYAFRGGSVDRGHNDWRYDELRLSDADNLIHEIEWADGAHWLIEASDVEFNWLPLGVRQSS